MSELIYRLVILPTYVVYRVAIMAVLHGMDCNNEVIELLFLGTVMQLYSCLVKWVNIHKM